MKIVSYSNMLNKSSFLAVAILYFTVNLFTTKVISQTENTYENLLVLYVNEDFKNCFNKSLK